MDTTRILGLFWDNGKEHGCYYSILLKDCFDEQCHCAGNKEAKQLWKCLKLGNS